MTNETPDLIATMTYLPTEQGGKSKHVISGFRANITFDGFGVLASSEQHFMDKEKVFPGDTTFSKIWITGTDYFKSALFVGQKFNITEGVKLVANGEVTKILNAELLRK